MSQFCPACGQPKPQQTTADILNRLEDFCREKGIDVGPDGSVSEADAAKLINRKQSTLKKWRLYEEPIPSFKFDGRTRYFVRQLALYVARNTKSPVITGDNRG